jgi:hypothetical protein
VVAALAGLAGPARPATPRNDLLRLVPSDVGFCVVLTDLRGYAEKIVASSWFKKLREAPLIRAAAKAPEAQKLRNLEDLLQKRLKVGLARLWTDLLGDAVVFAYRPGPPDKPEKDQGLLLVYARDADLLERVVKVLNTDLKKKPEDRMYREVKYFRRVESAGKVSYYYLNGKELAFSSGEEMLRQVIDRVLERKAGGKDKEGFSLGEKLRGLGVEKALLAVWVNPAVFTPHIRKKAESVKGPEAALFQNILTYWKALEGLGLGVSVGKDVEVKVAVRANAKRLPAAARRFFTEASKPSELWNRFPPNALFAMAGRIDAVAFAEFLGDFLPQEGKKAFKSGLNAGLEKGLGLDLAKDVLPSLGPDWGLCITAPADKEVLVPHLTWALRVQTGPNKPAADKALLSGLNTLAFFAVFQSNHLQLKTVKQDKVEVKYLESDQVFPAGFKPAFAVKDGYLLLTSSPDAVKTFSKRSSPGATASGEVPVLRVALREWGRFLKARREPFTKYVADKDGISRDQAGKHLDGLLWMLDLFDRLELNQRTGDGLATWTLRLVPAQPAKKGKGDG